jgi:hypothetical protein
VEFVCDFGEYCSVYNQALDRPWPKDMPDGCWFPMKNGVLPATPTVPIPSPANAGAAGGSGGMPDFSSMMKQVGKGGKSGKARKAPKVPSTEIKPLPGNTPASQLGNNNLAAPQSTDGVIRSQGH